MAGTAAFDDAPTFSNSIAAEDMSLSMEFTGILCDNDT